MVDYLKKKKRKKRRRIILLTLLVLFVAGWFVGDHLVKKKGYDGLWSFLTTTGSNYSESVDPDIAIRIEIDKDDFKKLEKVRDDALARGVIIQPEDPYVPCKIFYNGQKIKAEIRLKGKMTDHVKGEKWSFRVKTKKNDALLGMKRFTLQHPGTRSYIHEWVYHELSGREGIVRLNYEFINVTLNDNDLGVYALEEHFGQELLAHNERDPGPIFRFNPSLYWYYRLNDLNRITIVEEYTKFQNSQIEPFTQGSVMKDSTLKAEFGNAVLLMEAFRRGEVPAKDVLDVEKFARRHAILDLIGGYHSVDWSDVKFYYNPESQLIEPVAYESFSARKVKELIGHFRYTGNTGYADDFHERLFNDADFFRAYMRNLRRMSDDAYMDTFFEETDSALTHNLNIVYGEFPYKDFSKDVYRYNADIIRRSLDVPQAFHAYLEAQTDSGLMLQIGSIESLPAEIFKLSVGDEEWPLDAPIVVPAKKETDYVQYRKVRLPIQIPDSLFKEDLTLHFTMLGLEQDRKVIAMPTQFNDLSLIEGHYRSKPPTFRDFKFLDINERTKEIIIKEGKHVITKDLIIPKGWHLKGFGNITLDLTNQASIISYAPVQLKGNEATPVHLMSSDHTGQGMVILHATPSEMKHIVFDGLNKVSKFTFAHNAMLSLYETEVLLEDAVFINAKTNYAIKGGRSKVTVLHSFFSGMSFDAIRLHHCKSVINTVVFKDIGDQCVNITGGELVFNTVTMTDIGDEAFELKDDALVRGLKLTVTNANIGVEVRDATYFTLGESTFTNVRKGIKVHKKGDVFGPATAIVKGITMKDVEIPYDVEKSSSLTVDDKQIEPLPKDSVQ